MSFLSLLKRLTKTAPIVNRKPAAAAKRRPLSLLLEQLEARDVPSATLVAAYNFDQGSGGVLTDASGNGNNGTLSNASWVATGKYGGALSFSGAVNSFASVPNSASLNLTAGMTLEAWVDPKSLNSPDAGWSAAVAKEHVNSSNDIAYALYAANGTGTGPAGHVLVKGADQGAQGGSVLSLNQWSFLTATYDGATLKMYVNGALVGSQAVKGSITSTSNALKIGGDWSGEMFNGLIDNVRIYNGALSQSAIQADMNTAVGGSTSGPPVANAGPNESGPEGSTISFSGSATGGSGALSYSWSFGDGGTASGSLTPTHVYQEAGTYPATLTVTDSQGRTSSSSDTVTVGEVTPTASAGGPYSGVAGTAVGFSGSATDSPADTAAGFKYSWSFGDGAASTVQNPTHAYTAAGTYTAALTVTDADGLTASSSATVTVSNPAPPTANAGPGKSGNEGSALAFSGSASGGSGSLTYAWSFGDGATGSGTLTPSHTYAEAGTYTATLTVTDSLGQTATSSTTATVADVTPTASAGGPYSGVAGTAVGFSGSATDSPADTAAGFKYSWSFGDGAASTVQNPTHAYTAAGTYTAALTVTDADGLTASSSATVTVSNPAPPTANAGPGKSGNEGSALAFSGSASGGSGSLTYAWSFGDGATGSGTLTPSHTYAEAGTYTATLTVTDSLGQTATSSTTATVADVTPTASAGGPYSGVAGTAVGFSGSATDSPADTAAGFKYAWSFGDGAVSSVQNPTHAYTAAGNYSVTLTVTDADGLTASSSATATITQGSSQVFPNNSNPPPLPPPTGAVVNVSTVAQLQNAVANLKSGQTIMIAPGTYNLTGTLYVPQNLTNIAIRGADGKAGDVVIKGDAVINATAPYSGSAIWGAGSGVSGTMPFGIWLGNVQGVTIGDVTIENFVDDAIILNAGVQSPLIHDVVMLDTGEQLLKSNPNGSGGGVNNGVVEYCTIGYSVAAPNNYTNGIDVHTGQNWIIRDNVFKNILTTNPMTTTSAGALAGPAVLFWNGSGNATVTGNVFVNCQREIAFGLSDPTTITDDNTGGLISNNFIYRSGTQHGDVAIGVWNSPNTEVAYNTVVLNGDYVNAVEYRFSTTTGVKILYNLTDAAITQRDGASATVTGNVTTAKASWFVNESVGNLSLTAQATPAIGHGVYLPEVGTDYFGSPRPSTSAPDVGADQYVTSSAPAPTVTGVTPANGATEVSTATSVVVTFSGAVDPTTVNTNTIELFGPSNTLVAASVSFNASTDTATLTPTSALAQNTTYTLDVLGGTSGPVVKNTSGTPLAATFTSTFTTDPPAPPPPPPTANAGPNESGPEGSTITFSGSASGGSGTLTYSWSFSDGGTASGTLTPNHVFVEAGSYTATLTVTDSLGRSNSSSDTITVAEVTPTASAGGPYSGVAGKAVGFTGSATDSAADVAAGLKYAWSFGDGAASTVQNPTHAYTAAGTYTAALTVTDADGLTASSSATVTVSNPAPPTANAGPGKSGNEGSALAFSGSASGGSGSLTYAWSFGDGATGSGTLTPSHTYAEAGTYTATLTVTDSLGQTATSSTTATVADVTPTASAGGPYSGVAGTAVGFSGSATDSPADTAAGFKYSWSFGDGAASTVQNPTHAYTAAGTYTATLTVTDADGLTASSSATVTVSSSGSNLFDSDPYITTPYLKIPNFGAKPTIYSVASGAWSNPATWNLGRVPTAGDIVDVNPGTTVTYDLNDSTDAVPLNTVEIQATGTLTFRTDVNTQICVANFMVLPGGNLVVGTAANPIAANVHANIDIANQALNGTTDPSQFGDGLIVLGNVTMHGATKTPYVTLSQEAHAGDAVLHLASPAAGWQAGDDLVLPDTRQITGDGATGYNYQPQWEQLTIAGVSADGLTVTLTSALKFSHLGARDANGVLDFLPQVMNDDRNIMVESQSMTGTRGYTLFTGYGSVDVEYAGFCELGRSTGSNTADRYAMTVLDLIGPNTPQANGYQYTFLGNAVDNDGDGNAKNPSNLIWGLAVNNSYYGLIQDNDVDSVAGSGIGVEDAASSYNRFDGNFVVNVTGSSSRYDQQLQGDAFWFHNPNNYVTNNIASDINGGSWDVFSYGYDIDASTGAQFGGVGTVSIAAYQGADPSAAGQSRQVNMNDTPILAFSGNSVYGATQSGMTLWWIGTFGDTPYADAQVSVVKNFTAWNFATRGFYGYPTNDVTIDGMVVRGDESLLGNQFNYVTGINFDDYMTHGLVITNADIQGMATGIEAPFMVGRTSAMDTTVIENSYLDNTVNIDLTPARSVNGSSGLSPQTLNINNVQFAHPGTAPKAWWLDISMDYVTSDSLGTSNMSASQYVFVTNYDGVTGDNFQVFYTQSNSPTGTPPAGSTTRAYIGGYVKKM